MKRNLAIDSYIHSLEDYEIYNILDTLHEYDGDFKSYIWYPMGDFDERTAYLTHTELMRSEGAYFSICDSWFRFNHGELESTNTDEVCREALGAVPDLVSYCIHEFVGHTGDAALDRMINAGLYAEFDESYNPL